MSLGNMVRILLLLLALPGCRDVVEPFRSNDQSERFGTPVRLTFSSGDDRSPAWSRGSDTVYYSASMTDYEPNVDGLLMAIARSGGAAARPLLEAQAGQAVPADLVEPAADPNGRGLAFVELRPPLPQSPCSYTWLTCQRNARPLSSPRLMETWLGVSDSANAGDWRVVDILRFEGGATSVDPVGQSVAYRSRYTRHQHAWLTQGALPFKPAWSPDGRSIATADDSGLHVMEISTGTRTTIATGDVANPSWSPNGRWIAFDRVERVDSVVDLCNYEIPDPKTGEPVTNCWEERIFYQFSPLTLVLTTPDGATVTDLGPGGDPAWDPTGRWLYFVGPSGIARYDLQTGATVEVPNTEDGGEPEVSPDGRWLAFTRHVAETGSRDVWVTELSSSEGER